MGFKEATGFDTEWLSFFIFHFSSFLSISFLYFLSSFLSGFQMSDDEGGDEPFQNITPNDGKGKGVSCPPPFWNTFGAGIKKLSKPSFAIRMITSFSDRRRGEGPVE